MQTDPPEPLTPADADLRDFPYMPLLVGRLRRSKAWLMAKRQPALGFYMINLWCAAWHDVPAGSLEDDDDVLADLAMCEHAKWLKLKEKVLRGWVKCSDGRLYHTVVAEQVNDAWSKRLSYRDRLHKARAARMQRQSDANHTPTDNSIIEPMIGQTIDLLSPIREGEGEKEGRKKEREERGDLRSLAHLTASDRIGAEIAFHRTFWPIYPRKVGKDAALRAFIKACQHAPPEQIVAGACAYRFNPDAQYQPHPATWLNAGSWKVEADTAPITVEKSAEKFTSVDAHNLILNGGAREAPLDYFDADPGSWRPR